MNNDTEIKKAIAAFEELAKAMALLERRRSLARDALALLGVHDYGNVRVIEIKPCIIRRHKRSAHIRVYRKKKG